MATYTKPAHRNTTSDWFTANYTLTTNAERGVKASHDVRQETMFTRNETNNRTKWDQLDTNIRLSNRVDKIRDMKALLERLLDQLDAEMKNLNESMDEMEKFLLDWNTRHHINVENLVSREGRQDIDLVEDEVEEQLHKERVMLCEIKKQVQARIDEAYDILHVLHEIRRETAHNLQNKNITLDIDTDQYNLTNESAAVTHKLDPTRVEPETLTVTQWEEYCLQQERRAKTELANSVRMRECILATLHQVINDVTSQNLAVLYSLRKRVHEYEMALDELMWQKEKTEKEIAEQEEEIRRIKADIASTAAALKLAETRLEHRTYRPNEELVKDNVQYGLTDEVKQLEATLRALKDRLYQAQHALDCLEQNLHRINTDIYHKRNSLNIDRQCIESRARLEPAHPLTVTERNQRLVGGARDKSDTLAF